MMDKSLHRVACPNQEQAKLNFEEILRQNERRIHYHIHKLNTQDPHN